MSVSRRILLAFVLVQLASAALVAGWYFYILRSELIGLTRQSVQDSVVGSVESIEEYFRPTEALADAAHYLLGEGVIAADRPVELERYFVAQLRARPEIAGLYVGYPDGAFFYVMRSDEESAGGTRTKIIRQRPEGREVELTWRDRDFAVVRKDLDAQDQYDPRARDWYKAAVENDGQAWTEPYVFFTSKKPGITLASAIRDSGGTVSAVLGIDIEISQISSVLTRSSLGVRGSAYIVTSDGKVVANSNADTVMSGGGGNAPRFRTISELSGAEGAIDPKTLEQFVHRSGSTRLTISDVDVGGQDSFVAVGQMSNVNWPWQVVVVAPRSVGQGAASRAGIMFYSAIFFAALVACFVGFAVARSVGRQMELLRSNARQARHGNIEAMEPVETTAKEIAETDEALRHLAKLYRAQGWSNGPERTD
jgi:Cache domain